MVRPSRVAILGASLVLLASAATAEPFLLAGYGSYLVLGDDDVLPAMNQPGLAPKAAIRYVDRSPAPDCMYYAPTGIYVSTGHVRLTPCVNSPAFSVVQDRDSAERGTPFRPDSGFQHVVYVDADDDGRYGARDLVYLTTDPDGRLIEKEGNTTWSLRLSSVPEFEDGLFYTDEEIDPALNVTKLPDAMFAGMDVDLDGRTQVGDLLYLAPRNVGDGERFPLYSLRLLGRDQPGGTQIVLDDLEARPAPTAAGDNDPLTSSNVKHVDAGQPNGVGDDCFYYGPNAGAIQVNDLRLVPCGERSAGSLVDAEDKDELAASVLSSSGYAKTVYVDVDNNGRYADGDWVYLTSSTLGLIQPPLSATAWTIRLTAIPGGPEGGRIVLTGDEDAGQIGADFVPGSGIALCDADESGSLTPGDRAYLSRGPSGTGKPLPLYSLRLLESGACLPKNATVAPTQRNLEDTSTPSAEEPAPSETQETTVQTPARTKTPGFEALGLATALVVSAALVSWRRP